MPAHKSTKLYHGLTLILAIAVLLAIGFNFSRPQSTSSIHPADDQPSTYAQTPSVTNSIEVTSTQAPTSQTTTLPNLKSKANRVLGRMVGDILVEVTSAKIIDTGVEIRVCYATPDSGDWYPMFSHLYFSTYEIYPDEFDFLTEDRADGSKYGKRCVAVRYKIDKIDKIDTTITPIFFGIEELYAVQREGSPCESFQDRLNTSAKAIAYGLKVKCSEFDNGTQFSVELIEHKAMVEESTAKLTLDEIVHGTVTGPWTFIITEIQK